MLPQFKFRIYQAKWLPTMLFISMLGLLDYTMQPLSIISHSKIKCIKSKPNISFSKSSRVNELEAWQLRMFLLKGKSDQREMAFLCSAAGQRNCG